MSERDGHEEHVYDGIVEHDNFLPRWWLAILYGSMVFALVYVLHYTFGPGPTLIEEYQSELREMDAAQAARIASGGAVGGGGPADTEDSLKAWAAVESHRKQGGAIYSAKCAVCHGAQGQGGIGPNLTDDYWLHGNRFLDIAKTVGAGVLDKGMPPWSAILKEDELRSVVAHVRLIHGTNPPNPKAPQGDKIAFE